MARLGNIQDYEKKKAQQAVETSPVTPAPITSQPSVTEGFKEMSNLNPQQPILQKLDVEKEPERLRNNYVQSFNTWEEAEKAGDISQQEFANAKIQEMVARGENPGEYMNVLSVLGSTESPAEKAKREKRERLGMVFNDLGNLIGNAANLYYTHRGGQYIDLNTANEQHRERMQRIKDKQDALDEERKRMLANARGNDAKAARAEAAAKTKANNEAKAAKAKGEQELKMMEIKHLHEFGIINAKEAAELGKIKTQAELDEKLAKIKHGYNVALKGMPTYSDLQGDSKVEDSAIDSNGEIWTRSTNLTDSELRQIAQSSPMYDTERFKEQFRDPKTGKEDVRAMATYLMATKQVKPEVYEQMGMKKGKVSKKTSSLLPGTKSENLLPK